MQMKTLLSILAFLILGGAARIVFPYFFEALSFPGRLCVFAGPSGKCGRSRVVAATLITAGLFFYAYLAYTAFVVDLSLLAMQKQKVGSLVMVGSFFAVFFPLGVMLGDTRKKWIDAQRSFRQSLSEAFQNEANERERVLEVKAQAYAAAFLMSLIGFFVFASYPKAMGMLFGWISRINISY